MYTIDKKNYIIYEGSIRLSLGYIRYRILDRNYIISPGVYEVYEVYTIYVNHSSDLHMLYTYDWILYIHYDWYMIYKTEGWIYIIHNVEVYLYGKTIFQIQLGPLSKLHCWALQKEHMTGRMDSQDQAYGSSPSRVLIFPKHGYHPLQLSILVWKHHYFFLCSDVIFL